MTSINAPRAGAYRRSFAVPLAILSLLSVSCEKKAAPPPVTESRSKLSASRRIQNYATIDGGGGVYRAESQIRLPESVALASDGAPDALDTRKIIRNGSLDMLVNDVGQSTNKIGSIVTGVGGFVEKSTQTNSGGHSASVTVRVPAARLDPVIIQIKALATTVDRESVEARDVTREYIDLDARLRNAQAEEAQYLQILKRATTIKDTLDVTEKLADVRGRIEQMQGEMKFLTAQIEMSTLEIELRAEADAAVAGIHWRPLRQAKIAASEMVVGLADWVDSVVAFFINLPLIAVWFLSIVVLVVVVVRVVRFLWRRFGPKGWRLPWKRSVPPVSAPGQG
jgi:hypothetical protein